MATKKKMTTTLRVHTLAKELGVSSKDIIAKCEAEDVPNITNHMSAVSMGLAATIMEWFQAGGEDGGATTAVEIAKPVDVEAVRKRAAKKATAKKATKKSTTKAAAKKTTRKAAKKATAKRTTAKKATKKTS